MSNLIEFFILSPVRRDIRGEREAIAEVTFTYFQGDETGELKRYAIHDEFLEEWVFVDIKRLNAHQLDQIQEKINKYIFENPDMFDREPEEAS